MRQHCFPALPLIGFQGPSQVWDLGLALGLGWQGLRCGLVSSAAWVWLALDLVPNMDDGLDAMSGQQ